jgi:FimV-like protein
MASRQRLKLQYRRVIGGNRLTGVLAAMTLSFTLNGFAQDSDDDSTIPAAPFTSVASNELREIARNRASALRQITTSRVSFVDAGFALEDVQPQLEASLGVPLTLTAGAASIRYRGTVSGETGLAFIEELATKLNLEWALGQQTVYLSPEGVSGSLEFNVPNAEIGYSIVDLARQNFEGMGSNIRVTFRDEQVNVTGIPLWLEQFAEQVMPDLIEIAIEYSQPDVETSSGTSFSFAGSRPSTRRDDDRLQVMVFRLNNAYVDDKQISVGSNAVTFPGVAMLFSQFTGIRVSGGIRTQSIRTAQSNSRVPRIDPLAGERRLYYTEPEAQESDAPVTDVASPIPLYGPSIVADPRTNSLIVRDKPSMLGPYTELIKILDRPVEMVQLDAFVLDVKESRFNEFGLALSWSDASWTSPNIAPGGSVPDSANLILQATEGAQLLAQIRALESEGDSQVLTVPSVVTQNNLEASFSARESFYVKVEGNLDASLNEVTVETLLSVTPLVESLSETGGKNEIEDILNRRIRLMINIQDGSVEANDSQVVESLPRTLENQITTQAVVRGGETLIIGGQVVRKEISAETGLPIIRRLPLLGTLTNSRTNRYERFVRVYVVRPKILIDNTMIASGTTGSDNEFRVSSTEEENPSQESISTYPLFIENSLPTIDTEIERSSYKEFNAVTEVIQDNTADADSSASTKYPTVEELEQIADTNIRKTFESLEQPAAEHTPAAIEDIETELGSLSTSVNETMMTNNADENEERSEHENQSTQPLLIKAGVATIETERGWEREDDVNAVTEEVQSQAPDTESPARTDVDVNNNAVEVEINDPAFANSHSEELEDDYAIQFYGPVLRGETLWSIASRLTFQDISVQRMMVGLNRLNPKAFVGGDINKIMEGWVLTIPDRSTLLSISQEDVRTKVGGE